MSEIKYRLKLKWQTWIENIEWHIKTNKPSEEERKPMYHRINDYKEVLVDIDSLALSQEQRIKELEIGLSVAIDNLPDIMPRIKSELTALLIRQETELITDKKGKE